MKKTKRSKLQEIENEIGLQKLIMEAEIEPMPDDIEGMKKVLMKMTKSEMAINFIAMSKMNEGYINRLRKDISELSKELDAYRKNHREVANELFGFLALLDTLGKGQDTISHIVRFITGTVRSIFHISAGIYGKLSEEEERRYSGQEDRPRNQSNRE